MDKLTRETRYQVNDAYQVNDVFQKKASFFKKGPMSHLLLTFLDPGRDTMVSVRITPGIVHSGRKLLAQGGYFFEVVPMSVSKYETHVQPYLDDILEWLKQGMNEYSICDKLGVCKDAWIRYKNTHNDLKDLFTRAIHERACLVKNKQFDKACGITVQLKKQKVDKLGNVVDIIEEVYVPPDVQAAEFWSRHYDPDYVPPKSSAIQVTQNFQLDKAKEQIGQLLSEYKNLEPIEITDFQVMDEE